MILYGHNMMDGSMFKPLISYLEPNFRETHKDIFLEIDGRQYRYALLDVLETNTQCSLYQYTDLTTLPQSLTFGRRSLRKPI